MSTKKISLLVGNALITALFIMSLIAITATSMIRQLKIDIAQTNRFIESNRLYLAAQIGSMWALAQLQDHATPLSLLNDNGLVLSYPTELASVYEGATLSGGIYDLQSFFNLNSLTQKESMEVFQRLIASVRPDLDQNFIKMIVSATKDWVSPQTGIESNKWQQYYSALPQPYQAAHQAMQSPSEFRLVSGVRNDIFKTLRPYITTLPEPTTININTASAPVLKAFNPKLSESQLNEFLSFRKQNPITSSLLFNRVMSSFPFNKTTSGFESRYFLSITHAKNKHRSFILFALIERLPSQKKLLQTHVIRESMNDW